MIKYRSVPLIMIYDQSDIQKNKTMILNMPEYDHTKMVKHLLTHLPCEPLSFWRLQETVVHLVGAGDYGCHGILIVWSGYSEQR